MKHLRLRVIDGGRDDLEKELIASIFRGELNEELAECLRPVRGHLSAIVSECAEEERGRLDDAEPQ